MIPPLSVGPTTFRYTLDALLVRVADLHRANGALVSAMGVLASDARALWNPERVILRAELSQLAAEVADVRDKLGGVIATLEPTESARATFATGAPWSWLRPLSKWVTANSPWEHSMQRWVPVTMTDRHSINAAPATLADRIARIPDGDSRIRIDRYDSADGTRFEVYIAGTQFAHGPNDPWWAGGNAELLSAGDSRSVSATEAALRDAGATATSPMTITGHSQGGAIALALANSGRYHVDAVFTVGTPAGLVEPVRGIPVVHVVHPADVVPALGGEIRTTPGTTWVAHPRDGEVGVDAHLAETYRETVVQIDRLGDPALTALERRLRVEGSGTAMWYTAGTTG